MTDTPDFEVAIVGTGFSGLGMAINLQKAGKRSFVLFEKADDVGGTWRENRYPGCACDVPSHLYSYSFEPNPRWTRMFAPQAEILDYIRHCTDKYGLRPHIRFRAEVTRAEWDEAGACWRVHVRGGERPTTARHLVFGLGALSRPAYPAVPGLERFRGRAFHSAEWDHDYDLSGKRVAVIGSGASAVQFVPQLVPRVARLHYFQRTPPWVLPRPDRAVTPVEQRLFAALPVTQRLYRYWIYAAMEARCLGFTVDQRIMRLVEAVARKHIARQIRDPRLQALVTPDYTAGCKRILMANDYYPALARPHVEVIREGVTAVTEEGVLTRDGTHRAVDAIIYGTGFRPTDLLLPMQVIGRGGRDINDAWRDGIEAYLGTSVSGYPNLYHLMGPNTGLGHNSMIFMIEAQIHYVLECMRLLARKGARAADVRADAQAAYNASLQARLARTVWASGCQSWYLDRRGRNSTLWPSFTFEFWARTLRFDPESYSFA